MAVKSTNHPTRLAFGLVALALAGGCSLRRQSSPVSTIPPVAGKQEVAFSLRKIDVKEGAGELMAARKCVYAHYTGWLTNGVKFDSSRDTMPNGRPRAPISFQQGARRVIPGWDAGFEGMRVGAQRRLFIPYQLGYGENGRPPAIPPRSELIFDVELMAVADTLSSVDGPPRIGASAPGQCPSWETISGAR